MKSDLSELIGKIARLAEERGWNQEDFARNAGLNRFTIRRIFHSDSERRLRNATVSACARALGVTVHELRTLSLERLLARMYQQPRPREDEQLRQRYELATQPELRSWSDRNPERSQQLTPDELDELLSLQGTGGPLTGPGVEHFVQLIERKRRLIQQVQAVAGTEYLDLLEKLVGLLFDKVRPYRERK